MKISVLTLFLIVAAVVAAGAQSVAEFRRKLAEPDSIRGTSVNVMEHGTAADAVNFRRDDPPKFITGYRICIYFDKRQDARQGAMETQEKFRLHFPDIPSYMAYENPAWTVTVGNCITKEEALILQHKVGRNFPRAFFWTGNIPIEEFLKEPEPEPMPEKTNEETVDAEI